MGSKAGNLACRISIQEGLLPSLRLLVDYLAAAFEQVVEE
ncbi:hypothetical protein R77564_03979 [Ralstonia sp. LMG 32965]|uniref:LysR family transcriptional regulator n=1 Tax=Ralstonia flatus TaxID=3058601 RepID=A0ABN9KI88_9RALS|nr:hypothetical protein R77564_03979 [Ralstonia sp. LMG 32965]